MGYNQEYQVIYRKKRKENEEMRQKYNQQVSNSITKKYHSNEEWREEYNRKRREKYHSTKNQNI